MTRPIYQEPAPPLTRTEAEAMISRAIDQHTKAWMWQSLAGAIIVAAIVWRVLR